MKGVTLSVVSKSGMDTKVNNLPERERTSGIHRYEKQWEIIENAQNNTVNSRSL
ncbi:MAG: hypothetical protein LBU89_10865 [Fibromonadaceae bacterium]|jgi:hypothetical protein|nr:hypothetical protein [Fibromonadaceae bacterium]